MNISIILLYNFNKLLFKFVFTNKYPCILCLVIYKFYLKEDIKLILKIKHSNKITQNKLSLSLKKHI